MFLCDVMYWRMNVYFHLMTSCVCVFTHVTMSTRAAAYHACKDTKPIIDGRKANVNLAYLEVKPQGIQGPETLCMFDVFDLAVSFKYI